MPPRRLTLVVDRVEASGTRLLAQLPGQSDGPPLTLRPVGLRRANGAATPRFAAEPARAHTDGGTVDRN